VRGRSTTVLLCFFLYFLVCGALAIFNRNESRFYLDAEDVFNTGKPGLRASAKTGRFAPLLKHYIGVFKLLITIAAASITFGGNPAGTGAISVAKNHPGVQHSLRRAFLHVYALSVRRIRAKCRRLHVVLILRGRRFGILVRDLLLSRIYSMGGTGVI
jgi:hypothetical protein